jgi:hypothetical protein
VATDEANPAAANPAATTITALESPATYGSPDVASA